MTEIQRPHRFSDRLDAEWSTIAAARRTVRTLRSWADLVPAEHSHQFVQATSAGALIRATHRDAGDAGNGLLLALVELAPHHELAGRIVIQRVLPGLVSAAAKYGFMSESGDVVEDAVGAAWIAIRKFETARRTEHVAAAIISDAIYLAFRRRARQQLPAETSTAPHVLGQRVPCPPPTALVELADVVRAAHHAGVASRDLHLIRELVRTGSPSAVARQQRVTPRTIRNRRERAITQLQRVVAVAA